MALSRKPLFAPKRFFLFQKKVGRWEEHDSRFKHIKGVEKGGLGVERSIRGGTSKHEILGQGTNQR